MNAVVPAIDSLMVSTEMAMHCAGSRAKAIVRGLVMKGHAPKRFCTVEVRERRLWAVLRFDGTTEELSIPLDLWLTGIAP